MVSPSWPCAARDQLRPREAAVAQVHRALEALLVLAPEHGGLPVRCAAPPPEHRSLRRLAQLHALEDGAGLGRAAGQQHVGGTDDLVGRERVQRMARPPAVSPGRRPSRPATSKAVKRMGSHGISLRVRGSCGRTLRERGDDPGGRDLADRAVVGIGDVDVAGRIDRGSPAGWRNGPRCPCHRRCRSRRPGRPAW